MKLCGQFTFCRHDRQSWNEEKYNLWKSVFFSQSPCVRRSYYLIGVLTFSDFQAPCHMPLLPKILGFWWSTCWEKKILSKSYIKRWRENPFSALEQWKRFIDHGLDRAFYLNHILTETWNAVRISRLLLYFRRRKKPRISRRPVSFLFFSGAKLIIRLISH